MYAAVVTSELTPGDMDEFVRIYRDDIAPVASTVAGFQSMRVLADRNSGKTVAIVFYDTEANARAAAESAPTQQFATALSRLSGTISRELYEVVVEA